MTKRVCSLYQPLRTLAAVPELQSPTIRLFNPCEGSPNEARVATTVLKSSDELGLNLIRAIEYESRDELSGNFIVRN